MFQQINQSQKNCGNHILIRSDGQHGFLREESKGPERARPSPISLFTGLDEKLFFKALGINEIGEICPKGNSVLHSYSASDMMKKKDCCSLSKKLQRSSSPRRNSIFRFFLLINCKIE
jgi:hypothetical protein